MTNPVRLPRGAQPAPHRKLGAGFTLVELLIVIFIITVLMGLVTVAVTTAKAKAAKANASSDISNFNQAITTYNSDMGLYPGYRIRADEVELETFNAFPELFKALYYDKEQGGGKNGPYLEKLKKDKIAVEDPDTETGYAKARISELNDPDVEKYYYDPWETPYVYRENKSKRGEDKRPWMINRHSYDVWSCGPDKKNQSWEGLLDEEEGGNGDDIGNW